MPKPYVRYRVAVGVDIAELEKDVNRLLEEEFVPVGGIAVIRNPGSGRVYYQAMWRDPRNLPQWLHALPTGETVTLTPEEVAGWCRGKNGTDAS